jgi:hypothetical protein
MPLPGKFCFWTPRPVPKSPTRRNESRLQRLTHCSWCASALPTGVRADAEYCGGRCRFQAAIDRGQSGRVNSTRVLKDGRISVVVYMNDTSIKAGQLVKVGLDS